MRRLLIVLNVALLAVLLISAPAALASDGPTIELVNEPSDGFTLGVDDSYTFNVDIESEGARFVVALVQPDEYYPGRAVFWDGRDRAAQAESAELQLTMTGKRSTEGLEGVSDWYGIDCSDNEAPMAIAVGVRYKGGVVVPKVFPFCVTVE